MSTGNHNHMTRDIKDYGKCARCDNYHLKIRMGEMAKFLDLASEAMAYTDTATLAWVGFVWGQRGDRIMAGEETFEDQNPPKPSFMSRGQ